ncbi:MAG: valine--tRNA ligase [Candidatus Pacebacteria bacterium]|nr:valine--tRNA ligase [Candidatus Paceibacterota bacterium]
MEKRYKPQKIEKKIYSFWEKNSFFKPNSTSKKKPWSCIMPPPNANAPLHVGHAVFVTVEDILARFYRMQQRPTLWLPGFDHAGFETQYVYEKKKGGVFSKNREEVYKNIWDYTQKNKKVAREQVKSLGASADWSREKFTLDPDVIENVYDTFKKLYKDGLIYRGERIINWCPKDKTSLSDLEVNYQNQKGKLWHIKYFIFDKNEVKPGKLKYITVATVRPETMFGDTAIAVNPNDKRYKKVVGKTAILPLVGRKIPIIADTKVDMEFGTGAVKVTPAHDPLDFEIAERHKLQKINVISEKTTIFLSGDFPEKIKESFNGLKTYEAREKIIEKLKSQEFIEKEEEYKHKISVCYKCKTPVEPLISKQWFVRVEPLAKKSIKLVKDGKINFYPEYYKKIFLHWMVNIHDWNISRQIVWGIRIPIWYCKNKVKNCNEIIVSNKKPQKCPRCNGDNLIPENDVFDTWFSSGQWPFVALGYPKSKDFKTFYPTSVMETGWDILFFWVARMIMLGTYVTGKIPFCDVILHGLVRDKDRQKMSKSKGNTIDPLAVVSEHGADALRMAVIFGNTTGKDTIISEEKVIGQRNFTNKIWNASRFVLTQLNKDFKPQKVKPKYTKKDKWILEEVKKTKKKVTKYIETYKIHQAANEIYHFFWHKFCDKTIEDCKKRIVNTNNNDDDRNTAKLILWKTLYESLKILHPFTPFITEEIYQKLPSKPKKALIIENWQ